jgi:SAM-dependent methyltransferase
MSYADLTVRDRSAVKRWVQRRRLQDALKPLRTSVVAGKPCSVLDYGAGNGELVRQMSAVARVDAWVFEPAPALMAEAKANLAALPSVTFLDRTRDTPADSFDFVFCLEVFEHLPVTPTREAAAEIHRLLKPGGLAVVGVPNELYSPALLKGMFRMGRRYGEFDARPGNVVRATLGQPPADRPVVEIAPGLPYHPHHLGFDHRRLEHALCSRFALVERWFSPLPFGGPALNTEVYFLLRKPAPEAAATQGNDGRS